MKLKCGCEITKVKDMGKEELKDYPKGISFIVDKFCAKHQKEHNEWVKNNYSPEELMEPMSKEERFG